MTAPHTRPVTRGITQAASSAVPSNGNAPSNVRIKLTGSGTTQWDILDPAGNSMRKAGVVPWGYNLGVYEYYSAAEADALVTQLISEGVTLVRLVGLNRWCGSPQKGIGDSRSIIDSSGNYLGLADAFADKKNPKNLAKLDVFVKAFTSRGVWVIIVIEGDILQSGTQDATGDPTTGTYDRALTMPEAASDPIPGGLADWGLAGGLNLFTSPTLRGTVFAQAKTLARKYASTPYIYAFEVASEPLPPANKFPGNVPRQYIYPGSANDGVYDNTWTFRAGNPNAVAFLGGASLGPGLGRMSLEEYQRTVISIMAPYNQNTPFIIGARSAYNLDPEGSEIVAALSDSTGPGGNLLAANKLIFTWDRLGAGTNQCAKTPNVCWVASKLKVPLFMNQLGERNTGDTNGTTGKDPGDGQTWGLRHAVRAFKQWGISGTIWDLRGNSAGGYGSSYSSGGADANGEGGTYTDVSPRRTNLAGVFAETYASIYAAAIAAANAEHAVLVFPKDDYSNCYASDGVTLLTPGTVTVGTTLVGKIVPVTDPDATGIVFTAAGGATNLKIDYPWQDAAGSTYLPSKFPVLSADNSVTTTNYLIGSIAFFGTTASGSTATGDESFAAMMQATPGANNTGMNFIHCGNSGTVDHWPQLKLLSTTYVVGAVVGDGPSGPTLTGTNTQGYVLQAGTPLVASIVKSGLKTNSAIKMFVNGIDDTGVVPGGYAGSATGETLVGTANTLTAQTVGAVSSLTRLRIFGANNTGDFIGTSAGFCLFRAAPSDANLRAIGRLLAWRSGGGYKA